MFEHTSRYYHLEEARYTLPDGREVTYKRRRFLPQGESIAAQSEIAVAPGDRLDLVAAEHLGDPLMFWQICDANNALNPIDLVAQLGRPLRIPLPQFEEET